MTGSKLKWLSMFAVLLAGCVTVPKYGELKPYDPECFMEQETAQVPLTNDRGYQWRVNVDVDGVQGMFVLDTGSDLTLVTPQFAQKLAQAGDEQYILTAHGIKTNYMKIGRLRMGTADFVGFYAPVVNLDHINRAMGTEVAGILGNNLLNKMSYEADWGRNLLTLKSRSSPPPEGAIPITIRHNRVFLRAYLDGKEAEFALDTGAYRSTLAAKELRRLRIPPERRSEIEAPRIDINSAQEVKQVEVRLDTFQAGPIVRTNYAIITWEHSALGMDLLRSWILRMDARQGWMALTRPSEAGVNPQER